MACQCIAGLAHTPANNLQITGDNLANHFLFGLLEKNRTAPMLVESEATSLTRLWNFLLRYWNTKISALQNSEMLRLPQCQTPRGPAVDDESGLEYHCSFSLFSVSHVKKFKKRSIVSSNWSGMISCPGWFLYRPIILPGLTNLNHTVKCTILNLWLNMNF